MNRQIETELTLRLENIQKDFLAMRELHPLIEAFKTHVQQINLEEIVSGFERNIQNNQRHWLVNKVSLSAVLFTYDSLEEENAHALAYGITSLDKSLIKQVQPYDLGDHDYADNFYAVPGISLEFCNPLTALNWQNIDKGIYRAIEVYFLDGYKELHKVFKYTTELALHIALKKHHNSIGFKSNGMNKPFHFLIQEHDCEVQPVFTID